MTLGALDDPKLPTDSLDAVLIFNAYHEMPEYSAVLSRIRQALKAGGRMVVVEPLHDSNRHLRRDEQVAKHEISPNVVVAELEAAGFTVDSPVRMFMAYTNAADPGGYWLVRGLR